MPSSSGGAASCGRGWLDAAMAAARAAHTASRETRIAASVAARCRREECGDAVAAAELRRRFCAAAAAPTGAGTAFSAAAESGTALLPCRRAIDALAARARGWLGLGLGSGSGSGLGLGLGLGLGASCCCACPGRCCVGGRCGAEEAAAAAAASGGARRLRTASRRLLPAAHATRGEAVVVARAVLRGAERGARPARRRMGEPRRLRGRHARAGGPLRGSVRCASGATAATARKEVCDGCMG